MSYYDYVVGQEIASKGYPFYALIQAAIRDADTYNLEKLESVFPEVVRELKLRYNSPGGLLAGETSQE